jgi:hypothetical protein
VPRLGQFLRVADLPQLDAAWHSGGDFAGLDQLIRGRDRTLDLRGIIGVLVANDVDLMTVAITRLRPGNDAFKPFRAWKEWHWIKLS